MTPETERLQHLADGIQIMREGVNALVAALVADGFTDEQARDIVTGIYRSLSAHPTDQEA